MYDTIVLDLCGGNILHKFLRAIGFSDITKKDLEIILKDIIDVPEIMRITRDSEDNEYTELSHEFFDRMGIKVVGSFDDKDSFHMEYYYPYYLGNNITTREKVDVEKHYDKESYAGVCDDVKLGVTLIFYLQNTADYLAEHRGKNAKPIYGAVLAGLSTEAKILLPIKQTVSKEKEYSRYQKRNELMTKAIDGNQEAIESLTLEDMDLYSLLSQRIVKEDILSIVSTTMIPYGIENDLYNIIAEIIDFEKVKNSITDEYVYIMNLKCNDLIFDVCINEKDLIGEPEIGRRFKGNLWLQGSICLE